jgi:hypothetical protein
MKFQFKTSTLFLTMAFVAIYLGAVAARANQLRIGRWSPAWLDPLGCAYHWVPLVFIAYAIGCKKLTWQITLLFAVVEALIMAFLLTGTYQRLAHYLFPEYMPRP